VHGELDYRVQVGQGFAMFTALQRMGVPSKLLYFPDEGHWVLKPKNSERWYETVLGWLDQHLGAAAGAAAPAAAAAAPGSTGTTPSAAAKSDKKAERKPKAR
jgi:hypothetical protein